MQIQENNIDAQINRIDDATKEKMLDYLLGSITDNLGISSESLRLVLRKARMQVEVGDAEQAIETFAAAMMFEPTNIECLSGFANCALILGHPDHALSAASMMVAVEPTNPVGYVLSGAACRMLGRFADAEEDFNDARRLARQSNKHGIADLTEKLMSSLPNAEPTIS